MTCLGIDTSNYTTSTALYSDSGEIIQEKRLLPVEEGQLGLRQSDAVFLHVKQLPPLLEALLPQAGERVSAVGVSLRPRDVPGSYMPCFLAGELAARGVAAALGVPWYGVSHQAGHLAAALAGADSLELMERDFLAFHVSGGTTECLLVRPGEERPLQVELLGETLDLNAGQVIDRVGGMLDLPFPAGPHLERLAAGAKNMHRAKATIRQGNCCLSGLENQCRALLERGEAGEEIAAFCQVSVGETVRAMARQAAKNHPGLPFVFAGGVMSNRVIRAMLEQALPGARFAPPALSADNAVGVAVLAAALHQKGIASC